jgi:type IV pilus assembly protein PilW
MEGVTPLPTMMIPLKREVSNQKMFSMNKPLPLNRRTPSRASAPQQGFSLVEIMVAMVIGLIGVLVIMQVARTAEAQRRLTIGSGESQNNGALAVYAVERDLKQAGYGFSSLSIIGCGLTIISGRTLDRFVPVIINPPTAKIPAGDANTDTLLIAYGNSEGAPEGDTINTVMPLGGGNQEIGLMSAANFKMLDGMGEWVFVAPMTPENGCARALARISAVNTLASTVTVPGLAAGEGENLFGLGLAPKIIGYAVRGGNLTTCDYMLSDCSQVGNWIAIANGIVSLRAQYGRDASLPKGIDTWDQTEPALPSPPEAPGAQEKLACGWTRIAAVRLALVARNGEPAGRECVSDASKCPTQAAPPWSGNVAAVENGNSEAAANAVKIDLSANDAWRHYRYQTYETVIPIRNIPWMGTCTP